MPSEEKRCRTVSVRFSSPEFSCIEAKAKRASMAVGKYLRNAAISGKTDPEAIRKITDIKSGISPGEYIRLAGIVSEVRQALTIEEVGLIKDLNVNLRNIGTNLNTVAAKASSGLPGDYRKDLRETMDALRTVKDHYTKKLLSYGRKNNKR